MPPSGRGRMAIALGVTFAVAVLPWATLGFATPLAFAMATAVLRSRVTGAATAIYAAPVVCILMLDGPEIAVLYGLFATCVVGGVHAVIISPQVFDRLSQVPGKRPAKT